MTKTIVASMYNRSNEVIEVMDRLFFPSLLRNASTDTEVVLLDNCSPLHKETDELFSKYATDLRAKFGNVVFKRNPKNLGFSKSYNIGIRMARGRSILVTNNDVYFPEGSIGTLFETLEANNYLMVGPITNARSTDTYQYCDRAPIISSYESAEIARFDAFAKVIASKFGDRRLTTDNLSGFCFAADALLLKELRGFDESYGYGYFEDTDLVQRAVESHGKEKIAIDLSVFVAHGGVAGTSQTMRQLPLKMRYSIFMNRLRYIRRWGLKHFLKRRRQIRLSRSTGKGTVSELWEEQ